MRSLDRLNAMSAQALAEALSGPPEQRAAILREAAEAGLADAQALYGQILLDGAGTAQDAKAAFAWFNKAAAQDHLMALNMVGRCYDLGWGVPVDKQRAAECFRISAERGLEWGMYNYATLLALGEGVAKDKPAALDWFRKAAGLGNAKAANYVGSFHEDGWVVPRDLSVAEAQYRIAAEGGDFRGAFNLARLLADRGEIDEALAWLGRIRQTATPAFMAKAERWLVTSGQDVLATKGIAALLGKGEAP
jgi:TPR repeat protein